MGDQAYLYPSSVGLGTKRHLPAAGADLTAAYAPTMCGRNLLTEAYARKVWRGRFVELVEVCSRCTAKAAKP